MTHGKIGMYIKLRVKFKIFYQVFIKFKYAHFM